MFFLRVCSLCVANLPDNTIRLFSRSTQCNSRLNFYCECSVPSLRISISDLYTPVFSKAVKSVALKQRERGTARRAKASFDPPLFA